jgi:hypothetical protein
MALQPFVGPWSLLQFRNLFYTDGKTPWTSDQPVLRPLPTHRTIQTQNKRTHTPNIHALSGILTPDPSVRASEDRDRQAEEMLSPNLNHTMIIATNFPLHHPLSYFHATMYVYVYTLTYEAQKG